MSPLPKEIDLICFDVDGTLVSHPQGLTIWEVLNVRYGGTTERNRERFSMYMDGNITYEAWVRMDIEDWIAGGATREQMLESIAEFDLVPGARDVTGELKQRGFKLGVISGTLDLLLDTMFPDHPFEDVYTNQVQFDDDGRLSGWRATPYDGRGKPYALREIAARHDVSMERTGFIGDGDNDIYMLGVSGCVVAYRPKSQRLADGADHIIHNEGLHDVLDIFGHPPVRE